ncbi:flagellar basal body rod protein FlgB [Asticcacaulis sp. AC402]|uniref:flagellar basal body rod protein FlgB n=1 Tax=Asticcacaulis sp. AC402 TaxID=1282361 RepID=UPI0003C3C541|nr:flagellar basal body rod protein FlgB [Asticcacaulis sp. AC402]ESQ74583.1 flagellar basal body rod protein FlgB [Asticcacaulis sp. AC402]
MSLNDIPLMGALKSRMGWLSDRQKVVAENVANASTPGFKPHDLSPQNFSALVRGEAPQGNMGLTLTNTQHMAPQTSFRPGVKVVLSPDSETTMDGNGVVLEEQMLRMAESRMQFQAAVGFYEKSMAMMRMAIKVPGR